MVLKVTKIVLLAALLILIATSKSSAAPSPPSTTATVSNEDIDNSTLSPGTKTAKAELKAERQVKEDSPDHHPNKVEAIQNKTSGVSETVDNSLVSVEKVEMPKSDSKEEDGVAEGKESAKSEADKNIFDPAERIPFQPPEDHKPTANKVIKTQKAP
ncbi:hypothetical protein HDV05_002479, partial [Chytridiales sp. JEL 0842]